MLCKGHFFTTGQPAYTSTAADRYTCRNTVRVRMEKLQVLEKCQAPLRIFTGQT